MKKISLLFILAFLNCSSSPNQVNVLLTFNSSVTGSIQNSIDQFVFVIGESGATQKLIFPATCLGCTTNSASCPAANQCLEPDCGFSSNQATFEPEIDFSQINEGATLSVTACALNGSNATVAAGSGSLTNSGGQSASITLSTTLTACDDSLPPVCP